MKRCDVLVVGAGPAGSSAALAAARAGVEVVMVDKRKVLGHPVQCAEWIPKMLTHEVSIPGSIIAQNVEGMRTFLPDGTIEGTMEETRAPGLMIDRMAFDQILAERAVDAGVSLHLSTRAVAQRGEKIVVRDERTGERSSYHPKVIVGADGPHSIVGKWIGSVNTIFVKGLQYTLPLAEPLDMTEVYFHPEIYGGYGWVFPKGRTANIGIGMRMKRGARRMDHLKQALDAFVGRLVKAGKVLNEKPTSIQAGSIPVGGPLRSQSDMIIMAGDAAGQTDPITGAGIPQAVVCGAIAGRTAARTLQREDLKDIMKYEATWRKIYGDPLDRAVRKRQLMESNWDSLDSVIRHCWPAFREYYRDVLDPPDPEMEELRTMDVYDLMDKARAGAHRRFRNGMTFFHPGMINYHGRYGKYQAVSITGKKCELGCDHCNSKLLEPMLHASSPEELIDVCQKLDRKGEIGCLLTGGSSLDGTLPWNDFIPAIREIKGSTDLFLSIHSGIMDPGTARELKDAGIDQALIDVIAEDDTIREVFHADYGVEGIDRTLKTLTSAGIPIVPHIIVGLNEWRITGELKAISMIENLRPRPQAVVVISFMPLPGTPMSKTPPPHYLDIARILAIVRMRMPEIPLFLGCARDRGNVNIDSTALECGVNGIVLPSDPAIELAKEYQLDVQWKRTCCSVPFLQEEE